MEGRDVDSMVLEGSTSGQFDIISLVLEADIVVQVVMAILVLASLFVWAIIFDKALRINSLKGRARRFEEAFWSGGSLEDLYERIGNRPRDPMTAVFAAAMREWRRSAARGFSTTDGLRQSLQQRIDRVMHVTVGREMEHLEKYMTFLASVGSSAPFIGLFGTVWGIMNSFQSIAAAQNTSLAVVAPGIAEALLATALGLVAAIPAVIGYNKLSADLNAYSHRLEAFTGEFVAIVSRQLEEKAA